MWPKTDLYRDSKDRKVLLQSNSFLTFVFACYIDESSICK